MKSLLIIDMQNDFLEGGSLPVKNGTSIITNINNLIKKYNTEKQLVIFTQDWHPKKHISFASTYNKKEFSKISFNGNLQVLWPDHCVQNTFGAQIVDSLLIKNTNKIIKKGTNINVDSYSAFFDNDNKSCTELDKYLKEKNVTEILIVGLALDYCVAYTALDAVKLGYKVSIDLSATKSINSLNKLKKLFEMLKNMSIKLIK